MEDKLFEKLDDLNIKDTNLLLDKDISLSLNSSTRKKIEESVMKRTGYYKESNTIKDKINDILGVILMKRKIALALSTAVVITLGGGGYAYAKTPVAYVSMDINPSVELGVNAFDKVVSVEAYNEDGEKLLEGDILINANINEAISTLLENAISEGYVTEDGSSAIEITTSTDKENVAAELDESLQEVVDETLDNNDVEAEVETENVALARRDEARRLGITPGKLNLIQKLQAFDPSIKVEDYKDSAVKDIQKKAKELRKLNKSDEVVADDNTDINTDASADDNVNTDTDTSSDVVNKENTLSETSVEQDAAPVVKSEKNNNSSINKESNGSTKKEENSNTNKQKDATTITKKQDKNIKLQGNGNSLKSEVDGKSNTKSRNKGNDQEKSKNN